MKKYVVVSNEKWLSVFEKSNGAKFYRSHRYTSEETPIEVALRYLRDSHYRAVKAEKVEEFIRLPFNTGVRYSAFEVIHSGNDGDEIEKEA